MDSDRFTMSADKYIAKHYLLVYLEDSIAQLLENKEENPKVVPVKFLSEYFSCVKNGNHTMFREFSFVKATPHNRASFVRLFWKCYRQIGRKGDLLSIQEYHSLLGLLCPDFPFSLVQKTARIVLIDDALDCLISFSDFVYALQVQFYYEEFLDKCGEIYQSLLQMHRSPRDPVVVPTSGSDGTLVHQNQHHPADGIDSMQFFRSICPICDKASYSTPPVRMLREILQGVPRISFYGFLMAISKSDAIHNHIGLLPHRTELLDGSDVELTSPMFKPPTKAGFVGAHPSLSASSDGSTSRRPSSLSSPLPTPSPSSTPTPAPLASQQTGSRRARSGQPIGLPRRQKPSIAQPSSTDTDSSSDSSDTV